MDTIKKQVNTYQEKLPVIFLICAGIAAVNTLCRADYNFILYLYMFYIWKFMANAKEAQNQEKISSFFILLYSLIIDIIWCIYWGGKWSSLKEDAEGGIHTFVLILSWIAIVLKIIVLIMICVLEWSGISKALPASLQQKLDNVDGFKELNEEKI